MRRVTLAAVLMIAGCGSAVEADPVTIAPLPPPTPAPAPIATADTPAVRLTVPEAEQPPTTTAPATTAPPPPPGGLWGLPFAPEGLSDCDEMTFYRQQFGLPARFDQLGWRESNCRNEDGVHTSCCWGYWQLHRMHFNGSGYVYGVNCEAYSYHDVNSDDALEKQKQACAAKALYDEVGASAWSL